jgi:5-methylcytosine-specific restriction endonuclease McrA
MDIATIYANTLKKFWKKFERSSQEDKIRILINYNKVWVSRPDLDWIRINRKDFLENFNQYPGSSCFVCHSKPIIRHHIIGIKHGGDNRGYNIIALCRPCHKKIHPWIH